MAGEILSLVTTSLLDLLGNPLFVGMVFLLVIGLVLLSTNLPIYAAIVVLLGLVSGLVSEGWLEGWIGALVYVLVGAIFFWVLYQIFKT